jgi:hypothetical protein
MDSGTVGLIITFITSIVVAYATAKYQTEIAAQSKFDESLRETRYEVYKALWKKTGLLPLWPRAEDVTYRALHDRSGEMRDWYFSVGGIYLSRASQKVYRDAQTKVHEVLAKHKDDYDGILAKDEYDAVQEKYSALRTALTKDVSSRRNAPDYLTDDSRLA